MQLSVLSSKIRYLKHWVRENITRLRTGPCSTRLNLYRISSWNPDSPKFHAKHVEVIFISPGNSQLECKPFFTGFSVCCQLIDTVELTFYNSDGPFQQFKKKKLQSKNEGGEDLSKNYELLKS